MKKDLSDKSRFKGLRIAITGANGSLGKFLVEEFKNNGAYVVGLTHSEKSNRNSYEANPDDWLIWSCGEEKLLSKRLVGLDNAYFLAKKIIEKKLSVRQTESLIRSLKSIKGKGKISKNPNLVSLESGIEEKTGIKVFIRNKKNIP